MKGTSPSVIPRAPFFDGEEPGEDVDRPLEVLRDHARRSLDVARSEPALARLRALLRRTAPAGDGPLRFADLVLDPASHEVARGERRIELSRTEFNLLALFLAHPRQVLTRGQIFERVWGYDFGAGSNALGVYVGYLRRKTEAGGEPRLLHTVRGVGYVLKEP